MKYYLKVLQNYAVFRGRARRAEYWNFYLFNMIFLIGFSFVGGLFDIYSLVILLPSVAVGVRRMHDTGNSGWYLLIPIYSIILLASKGEYGANKYGEDPKGNPLDEKVKSFGE